MARRGRHGCPRRPLTGPGPDFAALGLAEWSAPDPAATVADAAAQWQASPRWAALAESTRRSYGAALARLLAVFGRVRLRDWQPAWGNHLLEEQSDRPARANRDARVLSALFGHCVRRGWMRSNPCRELRLHPEPPRRRYVDDDEIAAFKAAASDRLAAYIDLKLATGARCGQLVALAWDDWDGQALRVAGAKGGADVQYVGPGVAAAVAAVAAAHGRREGGALIATTRGRPFASAQSWWRSVWQPAMAAHVAAGGSRWREHDLRAKVASDSESLALAQARLGHQSAAITERVYRRGPRVVASADDQGGAAARVGSDTLRSLTAAAPPDQPDLFDHVGGPAASLPEKSAGNRRSAERARSPLRRGCPAGPPASSDAAAASRPLTSNPAAAASIESPAPPGRAARKPDRRRDAGGPARAAK